MELTAIKLSLRQLRRNLSKAKRKPKSKNNLLKVEGIERKIASRLKVLADSGVTEKDILFKRQKQKQNGYYAGYRGYIASPEWAARRASYYENHERRCRSCGAKDKEIHLHHRTYERIGREDDSDLMPLCYSCHSILHFVQRALSLTVEVVTEAWIDSTNNCKEKKKIREALRSLSLKGFKAAWKALPEKSKEPLALLSSIFGALIKPKEEPIKQEVVSASLKKEITFARRTGDHAKYDKKVDALIKRLEKRPRT